MWPHPVLAARACFLTIVPWFFWEDLAHALHIPTCVSGTREPGTHSFMYAACTNVYTCQIHICILVKSANHSLGRRCTWQRKQHVQRPCGESEQVCSGTERGDCGCYGHIPIFLKGTFGNRQFCHLMQSVTQGLAQPC